MNDTDVPGRVCVLLCAAGGWCLVMAHNTSVAFLALGHIYHKATLINAYYYYYRAVPGKQMGAYDKLEVDNSDWSHTT